MWGSDGGGRKGGRGRGVLLISGWLPQKQTARSVHVVNECTLCKRLMCVCVSACVVACHLRVPLCCCLVLCEHTNQLPSSNTYQGICHELVH